MMVQFGSDDFFVDGYVESRRDFGGGGFEHATDGQDPRMIGKSAP